MSWDTNNQSYNTGFWTPEQWSKFGASGGIVDENGMLVVGNQTINPITGATTDIVKPDSGLLGLSNSQLGTITNLGGLAMKAVALPSQLDYYNTQTDLAKQQLANNAQSMADKKQFNANWANASNGLAARSV